jgi:hypothetical protein
MVSGGVVRLERWEVIRNETTYFNIRLFQFRNCTVTSYSMKRINMLGLNAGMALVGHADANRHALLNTRKLPVFNLQALPANPNSQPPCGSPGAMHSGLCSR